MTCLQNCLAVSLDSSRHCISQCAVHCATTTDAMVHENFIPLCCSEIRDAKADAVPGDLRNPHLCMLVDDKIFFQSTELSEGQFITISVSTELCAGAGLSTTTQIGCRVSSLFIQLTLVLSRRQRAGSLKTELCRLTCELYPLSNHPMY